MAEKAKGSRNCLKNFMCKPIARIFWTLYIIVNLARYINMK